MSFHLFLRKQLQNLHLNPRQSHLILRRMYAIGRLELVPTSTTHVHPTGNAALNMIMDVNLQQITVVAARRRRQVSSTLAFLIKLHSLEKIKRIQKMKNQIECFLCHLFYKRRIKSWATSSTNIKILILFFFYGCI